MVRSVLLAGFAIAALHAESAPPPPPPAANATAPSTWESGKLNFIPRAFQSHPAIDVMITTELTPLGKRMRQPTPQHPMSYELRDAGLTFEGDPIAGEKAPNAADLKAILVKSLQTSGYLPVKANQRPRIVIEYRWGSYNHLKPMGHDDPKALENLYVRALMVGGSQFAKDFMDARNARTMHFFEERDARTNFLVSVVRSDLYFVLAVAYDYPSWALGQRVKLWHTAISTDSRGIAMNESLPQMTSAAGPYLGRETTGPVRLNRQIVPRGQVQIGTPTVVEDIPSGPLKPAH
jgi:hypothetical protein